MIFLDDMLPMAESKKELEQLSQEVLLLLKLLGFRINHTSLDKCDHTWDS